MVFSLLFISSKGFFHPVLEKKIGVGRVEAIRVRQFKEPPEFMSLFGGEIIIRSGVRSAFSHAISLYHSLIASVNYFFFYELSQMIFFSFYSSFF